MRGDRRVRKDCSNGTRCAADQCQKEISLRMYDRPALTKQNSVDGKEHW